MIFDDPRYAEILQRFRATLGRRAANLRNDQLERAKGAPAPCKPVETKTLDILLWQTLGRAP